VWSPSQAAARRAAKRKSTYYIAIDASAFVSVLLALLLLLIGDTTPDRYQKGSVDLAVAKNAVLQTDALREDAMRVAVARDGRIYFRQTNIGPDELAVLIRKALDEGSKRKIYLAVDRRAKNGDVRGTLEQIQLSGITDVVILAERTPEAKNLSLKSQ
jgi:biopolymer transport protein ExbD